MGMDVLFLSICKSAVSKKKFPSYFYKTVFIPIKIPTTLHVLRLSLPPKFPENAKQRAGHSS
jgi:hypothetical protein